MAKKKSFSLLTLVVRIVIFSVFIFIAFKMIQLYSLTQTLHGLRNNQAVYKKQIQDLQHNIEKADTDFFIEKKAREESSLAKPGDFVIKFTSK